MRRCGNETGNNPGTGAERRLRLKLGAWRLQIYRQILWLTSGLHFARKRLDSGCHHLCAAHRTPLLRRLKDVEMDLQRSKVTNLRLAAAKLDGVVLLPGETLSFWKMVGRPTRRKGYREGMVLRNGRVASGVGGGLCQMTNLLYWMTLHTPLTITERHRHGYDVFPDADRTQPFGSGATCFYNYLDLMIRNDTAQNWRLSRVWLIPIWRGRGIPICPSYAGTRFMKRSTISKGSTGAAIPGTTACSAGCLTGEGTRSETSLSPRTMRL